MDGRYSYSAVLPEGYDFQYQVFADPGLETPLLTDTDTDAGAAAEWIVVSATADRDDAALRHEFRPRSPPAP